jgi:hypothetical protein
MAVVRALTRWLTRRRGAEQRLAALQRISRLGDELEGECEVVVRLDVYLSTFWT